MTEIELVSENLQFPEGPISVSDGSILLVEIRAQTLTRIYPDGHTEVVARLGGGPNGAAIGPDGAVYICNNGGFEWSDLPDGSTLPHGTATDYETGSIQKVDLQSEAVTVLYTACDGIPLRGPNDIVFDKSGNFWFTDFGKSNATHMDHGAVYYAHADGSHIHRIPMSFFTPNGIGLSPDGSLLHVAETVTSRIWSFEIASPGSLKPPANMFAPEGVLGPLPGYQLVDSLAVEADGTICVATLMNGGITAYHLDGRTDHTALPDPLVTNICFGGRDMRDAWVTASSTGKLYKLRWPRPGLRLNWNI